MTSNMAVAVIYSYPVKGLSAERMDRVTLMPGECLPHDRRFAIALGSTHFDPESPVWLSKTHFIMLMRDEQLAQLHTRFDTESGVLGIAEDGRVLLRARLTEAEGCKRIAEFFGQSMDHWWSRHQGTPLPMRGPNRMRRPTNTSR